MKKTIVLLLACLSIISLASCDDTTDTLGSSLTKTEDVLSVSDATFKFTSRSILADSVLSRCLTTYLGRVKDPETGIYVNSNVITQFHSFEDYSYPAVDSLVNGVEADSCSLRLFFSSFYGDSLTSMKATVYELSKPVEDGDIYYSTFNPIEKGYVRLDEGAIKKSVAYTLADGNYTDSLRNSSSYSKNIQFRLNEPYTSKDGKTYSNYGSYLMAKYYENPSYYATPYSFIHNVCPGFYIKMDNGAGCMAKIYLTQLNAYFHYLSNGSSQSGIANFSGTEEVRQLTETDNDLEGMQRLVDDNQCTYVKSPAGIYTELTLPVEDICNGHEEDSINSAKIILHCIRNAVEGEYAFNPPSTLLMLEKDSLTSFFEKGKLTDNRRTFTSSYASSTNSYTFGNIGQLVKTMYNSLPYDKAEWDAYKKANPNWNKVLLVPVNASYTTVGSSSITTSITHDMSLSSVRLVGGSENENGDLEITVVYSKFKQ